MSNKLKLYNFKPFSISKDYFDRLKGYCDQRIWFTRLDQFNDPFEKKTLIKKMSSKEILNSKKAFDHYVENLNMNEETLKDTLKTPEALKKLGNTLEEDIFKEHGAICFTDDPYNILMWSHYAGYHRGYCLIFEIDLDLILDHLRKNWHDDHEYLKQVLNPRNDGSNQEILSFRNEPDDKDKEFIFTRIIYKKERPLLEESRLIDFQSDNFDKYKFKKYLSQNSFGVKYEQWSYEREYRLIVNANSETCGLMDLKGYILGGSPFIKITGIILGCQFDKKSYEKIKKWVKSKGLELYFAKCSSEQYKINIVDSEGKETKF